MQFGFSPPEIHLSESEKCKQIELFSDSSLTIAIDERWSESESRDIKTYVQKDNFLSHPRQMSFRKKGNLKVCLNTNTKPESKYGLIILDIVNSSYSGGVWVNIDKGNVRNKGNILPISNNVIVAGQELLILSNSNDESNTLNLILLEIFLILSSILTILFIFLNRKKQLR